MVMLVIAVRLSLVSLDDHQSLENAGMVANESTQYSHAAPKLSTQTHKTLNNRHHTEKAGMVANESTQCSHVPPKQSTAHDKNGHQLNSAAIASRVLLLLLITVHVCFSLVTLDDRHSLKKAGMVATNESMQCSNAPPKHSTPHDNQGQQCHNLADLSCMLLFLLVTIHVASA
jgi:hypothetical protein